MAGTIEYLGEHLDISQSGISINIARKDIYTPFFHKYLGIEGTFLPRKSGLAAAAQSTRIPPIIFHSCCTLIPTSMLCTSRGVN